MRLKLSIPKPETGRAACFRLGIKKAFYSDGSVREEPIEPTQTGSADPNR